MAAVVAVGDLGDVDVALGVDSDAVWRVEPAGRVAVAFPSDAGEERPVGVVDGDAGAEVCANGVGSDSGEVFADVDDVARAAFVDVYGGRPRHVDPLGLVLAVLVEDLHAVVLAVADVDVAIAVYVDVVDDVELSDVGAGLAPRSEIVPVGVVLVDVGVGVPVGNVEIAVAGVDADVGRSSEGLAAHGRGGIAGVAEGEDELAVGGELSDGGVARVDAKDGVVGADGDAVRRGEDVFAPRAQEFSVAVEDDDGVSAAVEDVDVVAAVDGDGSGLSIGPAVGQFAPVVAGEFVVVFAAAELCHCLRFLL